MNNNDISVKQFSLSLPALPSAHAIECLVGLSTLEALAVLHRFFQRIAHVSFVKEETLSNKKRN
jgi:hypothetical protein